MKDGKEFKEEKIPSKEIKAPKGYIYADTLNTHNLASRQEGCSKCLLALEGHKNAEEEFRLAEWVYKLG